MSGAVGRGHTTAQSAKTDAEILQQFGLPPRVDPGHKASF